MLAIGPDLIMFGAIIHREAIGRGIQGMARFIELAATEAAASGDERQLMTRISSGDELAFRTLYGRHNLRIHRFLGRMLRNAAAAEDVLSEVFLDAWRQAGRYEGRSSVNTWLCAIARNKALEYLRKYPPAAKHADMPEIADASDTPDIMVQKSDKKALLRQCVERLGPEHRDVVELAYYHEKSIEDVGEILQIPLNTVKTRMFYARKKLSEMLLSAGIDRGWP
jgi:RNA polymerase sigma-70 factor (ECF subfamily)